MIVVDCIASTLKRSTVITIVVQEGRLQLQEGRLHFGLFDQAAEKACKNQFKKAVTGYAGDVPCRRCLARVTAAP